MNVRFATVVVLLVFGVVASVAARTAAAAPAPGPVIELMVVADYELFQRHGADTVAVIRSRVNGADHILRRELGVGLHLAEVVVFDTPDDPFVTPAANGAVVDLLVELGSYGASLFAERKRPDLLYLFTGRFVGLPAAITYLGGACGSPSSNAVGVVPPASDGFVLEHEIGHSLGAVHDNLTACAGGRYVMTTTASWPFFSPCSKADIEVERANDGCLLQEGPRTCGSSPDSDADGLCDELDRCDAGGTLFDAKLRLVAHRSVLVSGTLNAGTAAVDPAADGLRVIVQTPAGGEVFDVAVPGGAYDAGTGRGWRSNRAGTTWTFAAGAQSIGGIVSKVVVKADPKVPGWYHVTVKGLRAGVHPSIAGLEPRATIALGADGRCFEKRFAATACRSPGSGRTLSCRG